MDGRGGSGNGRGRYRVCGVSFRTSDRHHLLDGILDAVTIQRVDIVVSVSRCSIANIRCHGSFACSLLLLRLMPLYTGGGSVPPSTRSFVTDA
jgi:hypothetical protein